MENGVKMNAANSIINLSLLGGLQFLPGYKCQDRHDHKHPGCINPHDAGVQHHVHVGYSVLHLGCFVCLKRGDVCSVFRVCL